MLRPTSTAAGGGATVTGNVFRALLAYAGTRGHDPSRLASRFGLSWDTLQDLAARVPVATAQRIWAELPTILDDDDLGMNLAAFLAPQGGLLPMLVFTTAATVGDGIQRAMELQRMLAEGSVWEPAPAAPSRTRWVYTFDDPVAAAPRHALEFGLALMILVARRVAHPDVRYHAVRLRHAAPRNAAAHARLFGCDVTYGQPRDELEFDARLLALPVQTANPALLEHLSAHGRAMVHALPVSDALLDRVRHALRGLPPDAVPLAHAAHALRCSPRTLQRKLRDAGTSLQALLDEVRYQRAQEMLGDPARGLKDIAASLGFSEPAAFHRAFVRWSGRSPGQWRADRRG
ncbi:MAG: AraC family transcriptional regulator ligand-binding domain-containing protein [Polyangiales bacterium]